MSSQDRAQVWLAQAEDDYETGLLLKEKKFSAAAFFFQQASEKALKALALKRHLEYWGHSTLRLLQRIEPNLSADDPRYRCCRRLDFYYIPTRYPDAFPEGTASEHFGPEDAKEAEACARTILDWVRKSLAP